MESKLGQSSGTSGIAGYMDNTERSETTPLQGIHNEQKGLKVIISCLTVMTAIVSVALAAQMYYGDNKMVRHGSVVTDNHDCSLIGADIIRVGGNAVDAAIASTICMGVVYPHLTGIGGGGFMLIYDQKIGKPIECIDFRPSKSIDPVIGVPGFLAGLFAGNFLYGKLTWAQLIEPSIKLARGGFRVSESLFESAELLNFNSSENLKLKEWLKPLKTGSMVTSKELADTLQAVAANGADVYYNTTMTRELSGHARSKDIIGYKVGRGPCIESSFEGYNIFVPGNGSGGPMFLNSISHLNISETYNSTLLSVLLNLQGTVDLNWPFSSGVHVAVMDDNDLYASIVSGLGKVLGSQVMVPGGFILNNALEFGPVGEDLKAYSLAIPVILAESGNICGKRYISGASDLRDMLQLFSQLLLSKSDLQTSVEAPRARLSGNIYLEKRHAPSFSNEELNTLLSLGYTLKNATFPYPSLNTIMKQSDTINPYADSRGQGITSVVMPYSGIISVVMPYSGIISVVMPYSGIISVVMPYSGIISVMMPTQGKRILIYFNIFAFFSFR